MVEHVHRIRALRRADSLTTDWLALRHARLAADWGRYARSEAVHDRFFLKDLAHIGINRERVDRTRPFRSTSALARYLENGFHHFGGLPVVLYSYWTESNSEAASEMVISRFGETFGAAATKGATAHRRLDDALGHQRLIETLVSKLIQSERQLATATALLTNISILISAYFQELAAWGAAPPPEWDAIGQATGCG